MMDDLSKRVEALSAEKRELLEIFLKEKKIDTQWMAEAYVAPRDAVEEILAGLWEQVLGVERVGIHDNFFALGGDSILSIQIIATAAEAGLRIHRNQLFEHPTIAELAPLVSTASPHEAAEDEVVAGAVPLTPSQRALLAAGAETAIRYVMLEVHAADAARLERAARHLVARHDALRLGFERTQGTWRQLGAEPADDFFTRHDLSPLAHAEEEAAVRAATDRLHAGWDLSKAPLLRLELLERGAARPALLLVAVHSLVCDAESFRILLQELQTAYQQLQSGGEVRLVPASTSFRSWCRRLDRHAGTPALAAELDGWMARAAAPALPVDRSGNGESRESIRTVTVTLDEAETRALLQEVPAAQRTQVNEVLLTALAQTVAAWTGAAELRFDLEGSARTESVLGADLSRTVGACSFVYPVRISLAGADGPGGALRAVKEQLRGIPERGIGYSLLAGGAGPAGAAERLAGLPPASLLVTYQPHLDSGEAGDSPFRIAGAPLDADGADGADGRRSHPLIVAAGVAGGRVQVVWEHSEEIHDRATVEGLASRFAADLRALIGECLAGEEVGLTPSDFPEAELNQGELARLFGAA
jgi:non-ribosomal peptide synthase protein (TIGR01720 family)